MYLLAHLNNLRLVDMALTVTLEEGVKEKAPLQSETKEVYSKIIDFWCNEYTEECGPKLRDEIAADQEGNFFERSWEDVFTADLCNSFRLCANAIRSLCYIRNPALCIPTTKILVVTPNAAMVPLFHDVLAPVLRVTGTKLLTLNNIHDM